jgi:RNA polymerase sigma factor (sigma-70 family)
MPEFPSRSFDASFPTTRWSLVTKAQAGSSEEARLALESLCKDYWKPLFAFTRHLGHSDADASDTVQEFLSRFVHSGGFTRVDRATGRLRNFLLTSLRNHLTDEWRRKNARKNRIAKDAISLEEAIESKIPFLQPNAIPGEELFDREWAREIMDKTIERLSASYAKRNRSVLFEALIPLVASNPVPGEVLETLCKELGISSSKLTVSLSRLRERFGVTLRTVISETVEDESEIEEELRYLFRAAEA